MTGREHLRLYAGLRGVPRSEVEEHVNSLLDSLGLQGVADKVTAVQ
jgi:ABC-type multidrug transport system ATPase subunit